MRILFLDDDASRVDEFVSRTRLAVRHVTNVASFIEAMLESSWDLLMLDHDLGIGPDVQDGIVAARWLAENRLNTGDGCQIVIHSANPIGVSNMVEAIKHSDHLRVNVIHFAWAKASYDASKGLTFTL